MSGISKNVVPALFYVLFLRTELLTNKQQNNMKKKVFFAALALMMGTLHGALAQNFDLSAVAPSGQTLYYDVAWDHSSGVSEEVAILVHPGSVSNTGSWGTYEMPTGALVIPDSILPPYSGDSIPVRGIQSRAFMNCTGLTSVVIPNTVKVIGEEAFYMCTSLTSVTMPDTLSSIQISSNANNAYSFVANAIAPFTFSGCFQLSGNITIPEGVTTISDHAFTSTAITSITWPTTVTTIGGLAFASCGSLATVTMPNSVTLIEGGAFYNCYKTETINVPSTVQLVDYTYDWMNYPASTTFQLVKNINYTGSLIDLNNTYGVGAWGARTLNGYVENGYVYSNASKTCLTACDYTQTTVTLPTSVDTIGFGAFIWHQDLTRVVMPEGLDIIGSNAFNSCSGLTQIDIPSTVNTIEAYAFSYCSGMSDVTLPAALTTLYYDVFSGCNIDTLRMLGSVPPVYETNEGWWLNIDQTTGDTIWAYDTSLVNVPIVVPCHAGYDYRHAQGWSICNNIIDPCGDEVIYYTVTVNSADTTMGTASAGGEVEEGESFTIRAIANEGYHFTHWNDGDTNAERTVVVTSDTTFTAYFEADGGTEGIGDVDGMNAKVYSVNGQVVVEKATGLTVTLYDAAGRQLAVRRNEGAPLLFDVPASGTYLVKVGPAPARRIVVVK